MDILEYIFDECTVKYFGVENEPIIIIDSKLVKFEGGSKNNLTCFVEPAFHDDYAAFTVGKTNIWFIRRDSTFSKIKIFDMTKTVEYDVENPLKSNWSKNLGLGVSLENQLNKLKFKRLFKVTF